LKRALCSRFALLLALMATQPACREAPDKAPAASGVVARPPASTPPRLPEDLRRAFQDRQSCNLLKGCPPVSRLVALGEEAAGPACAFYRETQADADKYYRSRVLEALGRVGGGVAERCLTHALEHGRWLDRTVAAFALGDLRSEEARAALERTLASAGGRNLAIRAAVTYALGRIGGEVDPAPLWGVLGSDAAARAQWVYLRFVVRAAARMEAREQAPAVARWLADGDYYLKRECLRALATIGDERVIDPVSRALDDTYPGVRAAAGDTLRALTGRRDIRSTDAWRRWRDQRAAPQPDASDQEAQ
jgi:HEAT repeat protein